MVDTQVSPHSSAKNDTSDKSSDILERVLYRLTGGLPKCELNLIVQESKECEVALLEEIHMLEEALTAFTKVESEDTEVMVDAVTNSDDKNALLNTELLQSLVESSITPLDGYYTASALLGRLRNDMAVPSASSLKNIDPITTTTATITTALSNEEKAFTEFINPNSPFHTMYTKTIVEQETSLALWKKISMNRAAFVFKRPVKSEEAPGYTDRIYFPMDLSLIRKRILTNNIQTYIDFHNALALISHNCVKYNGA
jgi:hypothetical protein